MLVYTAADFEDFRVERPDMPPSMETDLEAVVSLLARNRWPWRLHATYNETISRALDVFEKVNREVPFDGLHWFIDHAETIDDRNIERIKVLGGGIAVQHRMAYQGEYFTQRYGAEKAAQSPPIRRMLAAGVPVAAGTDATRVASYNPWVGLYWLVTGKTVGGLRLYDERNRLDRTTALRLWTEGGAWFSSESGRKGRLVNGQFGDVVVLSDDYFAVDEDAIKDITSVLTVVGGRIVHGSGPFGSHAPPLPPASPDWSPVGVYGGYHAGPIAGAAAHRVAQPVTHAHARCSTDHHAGAGGLWGPMGCGCFAF
jgi:predicted amidohydrolase YtcJ